jgi:hypothetical protein
MDKGRVYEVALCFSEPFGLWLPSWLGHWESATGQGRRAASCIPIVSLYTFQKTFATDMYKRKADVLPSPSRVVLSRYTMMGMQI